MAAHRALFLLASLSLASLAQAPATTTSKKKTTLDISMPSLGELPKADGLKRVQEKQATLRSSEEAVYTVTALLHARGFRHDAKGALTPIAALTQIPLDGNPPMTEPFATAIRVKCPQKASTFIEIAVLDPRGDTTMSSKGHLSFFANKGDEAEWTVDWDPTPVRGPGDYQVLVRIAGQAVGTYPLKFSSPAK